MTISITDHHRIRRALVESMERREYTDAYQLVDMLRQAYAWRSSRIYRYYAEAAGITRRDWVRMMEHGTRQIKQ